MSHNSKLSLQERYEIYTMVFYRVQSADYDRDSFYICPKLDSMAAKLHGLRCNCKQDFPEFHKQKPWFKSTGEPWWPCLGKGKQKRLKALENAINLCLKQMSNVKR